MQNDHYRNRRPKSAMTLVYLRWRRICGENLSQPQLISRPSLPTNRISFRRMRGV